MTNRRWPFALLLAGVLLAACTNDGETTTTSEGTSPLTTAATTSTTSEPSGTTEPTSNLPDLGGRVVTVAVDNETFPFAFTSDGETTGWDYATLGAVCEGLNCELEFVVTASEQVLTAVSEGTVDVAGDGIILTEEVTALVDASQPLLPMEQRLIVRRDETRFDTVGEFGTDGGAAGAVEGTSNHQIAIDTWGTPRTTAFPDLPAAIAALLAGDIDAVVIYDYAGQGYVGEGDDEIKLIQGVLGSGQVGFVFPPGSDLVEPFDQALAELTRDGTLGTLAALWFAPASAS